MEEDKKIAPEKEDPRSPEDYIKRLEHTLKVKDEQIDHLIGALGLIRFGIMGAGTGRTIGE